MFKTEVKNRAGKVVARVGFSDRNGGHSLAPFNSLNLATHVGDAAIAVGMNRAFFAKEMGVPVEHITWPGLTHSINVGIVDQRLAHFPDVDILITKLRKQAMATLGADCVQLVAVEPEKLIAVSAHMGWKGAAAGLPDSFVNAVTELGGKLKDTKVWLGPTVCASCYVVPADRTIAVSEKLSAAATATGLDLREGLAEFLRSLGASVELVGGCTSCDEQYFSFRRDGVTGRQAGAVVLI